MNYNNAAKADEVVKDLESVCGIKVFASYLFILRIALTY